MLLQVADHGAYLYDAHFAAAHGYNVGRARTGSELCQRCVGGQKARTAYHTLLEVSNSILRPLSCDSLRSFIFPMPAQAENVAVSDEFQEYRKS